MADIGKKLCLRNIGRLRFKQRLLQFLGPLLNKRLKIPVVLVNLPVQRGILERIRGNEQQDGKQAQRSIVELRVLLVDDADKHPEHAITCRNGMQNRLLTPLLRWNENCLVMAQGVGKCSLAGLILNFVFKVLLHCNRLTINQLKLHIVFFDNEECRGPKLDQP